MPNIHSIRYNYRSSAGPLMAGMFFHWNEEALPHYYGWSELLWLYGVGTVKQQCFNLLPDAFEHWALFCQDKGGVSSTAAWRLQYRHGDQLLCLTSKWFNGGNSAIRKQPNVYTEDGCRRKHVRLVYVSWHSLVARWQRADWSAQQTMFSRSSQ